MKKFLTLTLCCMLAAGHLSAKIWRINNNSAVATDYREGQTAHDAAASGDTLYFESSVTQYAAFNVSKKLVIMGIGSFLSTYANYQQPNIPEASILEVRIGAGGDKTIVIGIKGNIVAQSVFDLELYRNNGRISISNSTNCTIRHNYITKLVLSGVQMDVSNNIVAGNIDAGPGTADINIHQNTINGNVWAWNAVVTNNIFFNGSPTLVSCHFTNNILSAAFYYANGTQVATETNGNILNIAPASNFVATGADDRYYQLLPTSPAKGAGVNGADCGATGGADPYKFNALQPPIPSIYKLELPSVASGNSMQAIISTRVN